ncbi:MAG: Ig-like domain-containing protein, partial [Nitrososphaeraceae archaeon]
INTSPGSGATGVAVTSSITATFSEPVQSWSSPTIFTVKNGAGTSIVGTLALSTDAKTVTFKPSSSLGFSTSYTVTITTGVKDKAGNAMTAGKTWSFVTSVGTTPPLP